MAFGVCTNCLSSFPPSTAQKWKNLQFFFDIVTTYNDEICYVKHVLDPLCVFFTLFGCWGGVGGGLQTATQTDSIRGAPKGAGAQPACAVFQPRQLKNGYFRN